MTGALGVLRRFLARRATVDRSTLRAGERPAQPVAVSHRVWVALG